MYFRGFFCGFKTFDIDYSLCVCVCVCVCILTDVSLHLCLSALCVLCTVNLKSPRHSPQSFH